MKITVTINGKQVKAEKGTTVLKAAASNNIYIPTLCHHGQLTPFGGCRLCIVEIENSRGYPTACTVPVADNMVVRTDTEKLQELRRNILKLILSEHPYSCLVCPQKVECTDFQGTIRKVGVTTGCQYCPANGQCELQTLTDYLDLKEIEFPIAYRGVPVEKDDPFFDRDYNLCILCGRCVRVCQEVRCRGTLAFTHRGNQSLVGTAFGRSHLDTDCEFCGSCVDVCPVGALADKRSKWEGMPNRTVSSICPYCSLGCTLDYNLQNGRIISTKPNEEGVVNQGQACVRGRFGIVDLIHNESRLKAPMIKKDGQWDEVTWGEAVRKVAENFAKYDGDECAVISSPNCTNEDNFVFQKFARVALKTNNIDFCTSSLSNGALRPNSQSNGTKSPKTSIQEIVDAKCILVVGSNVSESHPVAGIKIKQAVRKGAKLIVIDPRRIELADFANIWLQPNPDADASILMGVMKALVAHSSAENSQCELSAKFVALLDNFDLSSVEDLTGISKEKIVETAAVLVTQKPAVILYGSGITQHPSSTKNISALQHLALFLGKDNRPANLISLPGENNIIGAHDMGTLPYLLPGHVSVGDKHGRSKFEVSWNCKLNEKPGFTYGAIIRAIESSRIKALYAIGEVPPLPCLQNLEFLVVQNIFPTKNMEHAHVALPASSFAETNGTYTNFEGRVQRVKELIRPLYQSKPDWWITCQVAKEMGISGFDFESPSKIMDEIARLVPGYGMVSYRKLKKNGVKIFLNGKNSEHKLVITDFKTSAGPRHERFPLTLITENNLFHYRAGSLVEHVKGMELIKRENVLEMNLADTDKLGITDGDTVRIECANGHAHTKAKLSDGVPAGSAFMSLNAAMGSELFAHGMPSKKSYSVRIERV